MLGSSSNSVHIKISVGGAVQWRYQYNDRGTAYQGKYDDSTPHEHAIGMTGELNMQDDDWTFWFINITDKVVHTKATIIWVQGNDTVGQWDSPDISIDPNSGQTALDDALLVLNQ